MTAPEETITTDDAPVAVPSDPADLDAPQDGERGFPPDVVEAATAPVSQDVMPGHEAVDALYFLASQVDMISDSGSGYASALLMADGWTKERIAATVVTCARLMQAFEMAGDDLRKMADALTAPK